ncbi:MAG: hypothetical protein ACI9KN_002178 [Gammaproteobacteria bacterium]|jgi:hypothetical protein
MKTQSILNSNLELNHLYRYSLYFLSAFQRHRLMHFWISLKRVKPFASDSLMKFPGLIQAKVTLRSVLQIYMLWVF